MGPMSLTEMSVGSTTEIVFTAFAVKELVVSMIPIGIIMFAVGTAITADGVDEAEGVIMAFVAAAAAVAIVFIFGVVGWVVF